MSLLQQVLGSGELPAPLTIHAASFSEGAKQKIEAAGGTIVLVPQKPTWTRKLHKQRLAAAEAAGTSIKGSKKAGQ